VNILELPGRVRLATGIVAGVVILIGLAVVLHRPAPDPAPIPPTLAAAVERHAIASAVDTSVVHQLHVAAESLRASQRRDSARAESFEQIAQAEQKRADSLEAAAATAKTAADSATTYHAALDERTAEVRTLEAASGVKDSEITKANARADSLEKAGARESARAARADSVMRSAIAEVQRREPPCRVLFFSCPSRTTSAFAGAVVGAVGDRVATIALSHPPHP
jgi:hypothetical protein